MLAATCIAEPTVVRPQGDSLWCLLMLQAGEAEGAAAMNVQLSLDETYADITPVRQNPDCMSAFVSIMRGCNNSECHVPPHLTTRVPSLQQGQHKCVHSLAAVYAPRTC